MGGFTLAQYPYLFRRDRHHLGRLRLKALIVVRAWTRRLIRVAANRYVSRGIQNGEEPKLVVGATRKRKVSF